MIKLFFLSSFYLISKKYDWAALSEKNNYMEQLVNPFFPFYLQLIQPVNICAARAAPALASENEWKTAAAAFWEKTERVDLTEWLITIILKRKLPPSEKGEEKNCGKHAQ